ncbi:MAG: PDZ domain-containing protein [bacterium]|nr:PDZ domain-containing protein [bacterium]
MRTKKYAGLQFIGLFIPIIIGIIASATFGAEKEGWLGVYIQEITLPMQVAIGIDYGVLVTDVVEESPADSVGIKAGDIIMEIDNKKIGNFDDLKQIISEKPCKPVKIKLFRKRKVDVLNVILGEREPREYEWKFFWPPTKEYMEEIRELRREIEELRKNLKSLLKELGKEYKEISKERIRIQYKRKITPDKFLKEVIPEEREI